MLSTCPSCLTQIKHEDHLLEVPCETCGTRFSTFLASEESEPAQKFSESLSAFQEVRDFGESLGFKSSAPEAESPSTDEPAPDTPIIDELPSEETPVPAQDLSEQTLVSPGDTLYGYQIESYYTPISLLSELATDTTDPLRAPLQQLFQQAAALGANAIVGFHWALLSDGRCLLSGVPVRAQKLS